MTPELRPRLRVLQALHAALAFATLAYVAVLLLAPARPPSKAPGQSMLLFTMAAAAVMDGVMGFVFYAMGTSPRYLLRHGTVAKAFGTWFGAVLVRGTLFHCIAVTGLVLGLIHGGLPAFLPFGIASLALMLAFRPIEPAFDRVYEAARRAAP